MKTNFYIKTEWHYHATAHGKKCLGGYMQSLKGGHLFAIFKRKAARASLLVKPTETILMAETL